ncbi:beta strand repeat-containing protein [Ekhidna sp.]|uniref:beta strand repeat-containing protein n=1 Tax=Ekhidna sp. TaxID=2608089 RepID=UPI003B594E4A
MTPIKNPRLVFQVLAFILTVFIARAQEFTAGINTETPNPNAVLHLVSPNGDQGLMIPALTNAQRGAMGLATTDKGLMVFDSDDSAFYFWDGSAWVNLNIPANIADGIDWTELTGIPANIDTDATDDVTLATFPNLDTDATDDVALSTIPAAGDISGDYTNGFQINPNIVSSLEITDGTISNADLGADAVQSGNILDGTIGDADVNAAANIGWTKIDKTGANVSEFTNDAGYIGAGSNISTLTNDAGFLTAVTSADITDGEIVDADINAAANIGWTKIDKTGANVSEFTNDAGYIGAGSNISTLTNDAGFLTAVTSADITDGEIVDADISGTAAIAGTKVAPNFGAQAVTTTGNISGANITASGTISGNGSGLTNVPAPTLTDGSIFIGDGTNAAIAQTLSGDVTITNTGVATIANDAVGTAEITDGTIATIDIADDNVTLAKLENGTADQVLVTDAAGNPTYIDQTTLVTGTASDLVAGGSVVADAEVDDDLTINTADDRFTLFDETNTGNTVTLEMAGLTAPQTYNLPDASGTLALEGAPVTDADVPDDITINTADDRFTLFDETNTGNTATLELAGLTAPQTYNLPDASGTLALEGAGGLWTDNSGDIHYNTGRVGIGTTTPSAELSLYGTADQATALTIDGQGATSNQLSALILHTLGDGATAIDQTGTNGWMMLGFGDAFSDPLRQNELTFSYYQGATEISSIFHLEPSGRIGIGTGDPAVTLDVVGTDAIRIPKGDDLDRPTASIGDEGLLRYSVEPGAEGFEGFDGSSWIPLGGGSSLIDNPLNQNLIAGFGAGSALTTGGDRNVLVGENSGSGITTGADNVTVGRNAGLNLTTGFRNVLVGSGANTGSTSQDVVGIGANVIVTGSGSIAIGQNSQANNIDGIAIGRGAQSNADDAISIGTLTNAINPNTIILGDGTNSNYSVGIGTQNPRVPLQIGADFGIGHFENVNDVLPDPPIFGDALVSNLYVDYSNAQDNKLRRTNGNSGSFIFFENGGISFHSVAAGAVDSEVTLNSDVQSFMEMRSDGNVYIEEGLVLNSTDPGEEQPGMIQWTGSDFEGNTDGTPGGWVSLTGGGGFMLPYNPGPQSFASTLFHLTQTDAGNGAGFFEVNAGTSGVAALQARSNGGPTSAAFYAEHVGAGSAGRFQVTNVSNTAEALSASSDGAAGAIAFRAIGNVSADAGEFIADGTGTALQVNNTATSTGVVAAFQNSNVGNGNNVVSITTNGSGPALQINNTGTSGNAIRIDMNGANTVPGVEIVNSNGPSLTTDGFVGVGTVAPGSELDVVGETRTSTLNVASSRFVVANNGNTTINPSVAIDALNISQNNFARGIYVNMNGQVSNGIEIANSGGPSLVTDGNVGIGTVSPAAMLDVNGTANIASDATVGNLISTPNTDAIIDGNVSADTRVVVLTADDNITNISTPADGKEIFIIAGSGVNPQVSSGGNIRLDQAQGDFTMQSGSSIHLIYIENLSLWVEVSRSL